MIQDVATLPSGSKLSMQIAAWQIAANLRWTLAQELKAVGMDFSSGFIQGLLRVALTDTKTEEDKTKRRAALLTIIGNEEVDTLKNLLMQLGGSPRLEGVIFDCLISCTYNGVKITKDTFEPEDARADFYPLVWEVLKLNLRPFFKSLVSTLSSPTPPSGAAPRS